MRRHRRTAHTRRSPRPPISLPSQEMVLVVGNRCRLLPHRPSELPHRRPLSHGSRASSRARPTRRVLSPAPSSSVSLSAGAPSPISLVAARCMEKQTACRRPCASDGSILRLQPRPKSNLTSACALLEDRWSRKSASGTTRHRNKLPGHFVTKQINHPSSLLHNGNRHNLWLKRLSSSSLSTFLVDQLWTSFSRF